MVLTENPMLMMEHAENNMAVPPLVDPRVLATFCQAVTAYGASMGAQQEAGVKVRALQATLADLRNLATMCRFAVVGHPHSFARIVDELECLSVDFPSDTLPREKTAEFCEDEVDTRVDFTAAIDLFAGASFVSKDEPARRDRYVVALVRAIEAAIAFPVTFSLEAATYIGQGTGEIAPLHASIVIANATRRLFLGDYLCVPRAPRDLRGRLERLARHWMRANPVTTFFEVVAGPRVRHIVHWENPVRPRPDDAQVGDPVTLLLERRDGVPSMQPPPPPDAPNGASSDMAIMSAPADDGADPCDHGLGNLAVMFCPHQPAPVIRIVEDGLQVQVPAGACTGPIAVVNKSPDFATVGSVIDQYFARYPIEMASSVFGAVRMDQWTYPFAFSRPILEIARSVRDVPPRTNAPLARPAATKPTSNGPSAAADPKATPPAGAQPAANGGTR